MKTGIKVGDAMTQKPVYIHSGEPLQKCAELMHKQHVGAIIVKEKEEILGIVTEQDIVRKLIAKGMNPLEKKVADCMESNLVTMSPNMDIFDALIKMRDLNIRHIPVVDGKKLLGLITLKDILKIEPQLFDMLVEKFELREESRKPISKPNEGICQLCGEYSDELKLRDEVLICESCLRQ